MEKTIIYVIAVGGQLKEPSVDKIEISEEDIEGYLEEGDGTETREDAIMYFMNEEIDARAQHFSLAIALTAEEFETVNNKIKTL